MTGEGFRIFNFKNPNIDWNIFSFFFLIWKDYPTALHFYWPRHPKYTCINRSKSNGKEMKNVSFSIFHSFFLCVAQHFQDALSKRFFPLPLSPHLTMIYSTYITCVLYMRVLNQIYMGRCTVYTHEFYALTI